MSWLLVGLIPGLLMLATFGLDRLEAGLRRDTVSATDVAAFLAHARATDVDTLARDGMGTALERVGQRQHTPEPTRNGLTGNGAASDLPTRYYGHPEPNPGFQPTRHANRV
ncbi:hypothetical protein BHQ17_11005 [Mycolicibacterium holsaticum]|uniref:Uncharacterized protein n=2 Tax=Mycolicibacterium holsaticum TaxID=152142 RepID=A0A1E3RVT6_9MYCO|nr:hypothetical protein [Mycolicibacterium holsaticum DSM 44478 = JCM 12374]ODQ93969.1 hypothetical protein BHQ17_11005 [Mycolicibacterium holsaticum]QZA13095.1 hypothetical protein K3U96_02560 [Mycolicibacterium holsaticum DSM 44478 = JCM 12374]UNC09432.1 hypothetical protein H5U41_24265 [Mycolicibacterium holsaticum DSM 44478 = JCM 12374]